MTKFWEGFEKRAAGLGQPSALPQALTGLGLLAAAGGLSGALASTRKAKESNKTRAEAYGHVARDAAKARKKNLGQYLLNPEVPGPLEEVSSRLMRRHSASKAEHPVRSSMIPWYGLIRGGKAGEK